MSVGKTEGLNVAGLASAKAAGGQTSAEKPPERELQAVRPDKGGWLQKPKVALTWADGSETVFSMGKPGSGQVFDAEGNALTNEQVDSLVKQLASAYQSAPAKYGSTKAADAYQDALKLLAEALGKTEGQLLLKK